MLLGGCFMRQSAPSRKAVEIPESLDRDLTSYALAASVAGVAALALTPPAAAQIVYTSAHEAMSSDEKMFVDLNHDGINDLMLREIPCTSRSTFPSNSVQAVPAPQGGGIQLGNYYGGAAALPAGAVIGDGLRFTSRAVDMVNLADTYSSRYGSWANVPPSFLGIRFRIQGETHYGWARIELQFDGYSRYVEVILTGYAYETQPNVSIRAGDRGEDGENVEGSNGKASSPGATPESVVTLGTLARGARPASQPPCRI
jgi:hypothetical protein